MISLHRICGAPYARPATSTCGLIALRGQALQDRMQVSAPGQGCQARHVLDHHAPGPELRRDPQNLLVKVVPHVPDNAGADDRETLARRPGEQKVKLSGYDPRHVHKDASVYLAQVAEHELARQVRRMGPGT